MLKPGIIKGGCRAWPVLALSTLLFLFLFSGFAAAQTGTTISLIQTAGSTSDSASSIVSQGFGVNNTAGNLILVAVSWGDNPVVSLSASDTLGNTYFVATNDFDPGNRQGLAIIYAPNIRGGANIVTVNFGQADGYRRIIVSEYSGITTTSPLDAAAKHKASGTTATNGVTSTAANTITNGDLIFGVVMDDSGFFGTITAGTGFTRRAFVNNMDLATEDTVQAAAGPIAATFTFSRADTYLAQMAAFKAGGGSADTTPPTAPSNLVATAASGAQINLSWTASTDNVGVTGYRVERCQGAGCSIFVQIATPTGTTYSDSGLQASTSYSYRVRATDAAGNLSAYSNTASATTLVAPPAAPSNLVATAASSSQINLSWTNNASNQTGFKVERSTDGTTFTQIATTAATATTYSDAGLLPSTQYFYRVRATNSGGDSAYSNTASATTLAAPPVAPSNLVATAASSSQINLSWTNNASNQTGFKVERSPDGTTFTQIATTAATATTYSDAGLLPSTQYFYRVRATNSGGDSAYSNTASATTLAAPPAAPSNLVATAASSSQINLSWTNNASNQTGFKVERSTDGTTFTQIATTAATATTYSDGGLLPSAQYFYRVRATNSVGDSAYSNTASATTLVAPPAAPSSLVATAASSSQINLSWTNNASNQTGFKVE